MTSEGSFQYPFGDISCEYEITALKEQYPAYFYSFGRYTREALDADNYLFVGRRGSGKTSLTEYFNFQNQIPKAICINVSDPDIYNEVYRQVSIQTAATTHQMRIVAISHAVLLWRFVIWSLMIDRFSQDTATYFRMPRADGEPMWDISTGKGAVMTQLERVTGGDHKTALQSIDAYFLSEEFRNQQQRIVAAMRVRPLIVTVDSLEKYDTKDDALMAVTAGLIQCASDLNAEHERNGLHIKVFVAAEVFPHLKEHVVLNTAKYVRNPVYLLWRPRDLVHLIAWRFWKYLTTAPESAATAPRDIDWGNFDDVLGQLWHPYFGETLVNSRGLTENTFPYLLRHTQMRPRQVVQLCNAIARQAKKKGCGLSYYKVDIPEIVRQLESELADEVINSYSQVYPQVSTVVDALDEMPVTFHGNELDKIARMTRSAWPRGDYSLEAFRMLVAELGIVGKVRQRDKYGPNIIGEFEYAMVDRLTLSSDDECVIHPMFYGKLHTKMNESAIVFPSLDHLDPQLGEERWMLSDHRQTKERNGRHLHRFNGRLPGYYFELLQNALLDAFDETSLRGLVRIRLEVDLHAVAGGGNMQELVLNLISWADRTRRVHELVLGALVFNPRNEKLNDIAKKLGFP